MLFGWLRRKREPTKANEPPFITGTVDGSRSHRAAKILDWIDRSEPMAFQEMAWTMGDIARFYLNRFQHEGTVIGLCKDLSRADLLALADETEKVADSQLQKARESGDAKVSDYAAGFALLAALFDIHSREEQGDAEMRIAARIRSMAIAGRGTTMKAKTPDGGLMR